MNPGISVEALAQRVENEIAIKKDFVASSTALTAVQADTEGILFTLKGKGAFLPTDLSHSQVAEHLKIPITYYKRMLAEEPQLLTDNVNTWLHRQPKRRLLRTLSGEPNTLRAFLSEDYRPLENVDLMTAVLPTLQEQEAVIRSCQMTEQRLYIQASLPALHAEVGVGDVVEAGVLIANSEVGAGRIKVEALIYRLACLNGAVMQQLIQKRHVHRGGSFFDENGGDVQQYLSNETRQVIDQAFWMQMRDVIKGVFNQDFFDSTVSTLRKSAEDKIEDVEEVVEVVSKNYYFSSEEKKGLLTNLVSGADSSRWGLANAVTALAHTTASYDRSIDLERAGGDILQLPSLKQLVRN